MRAAPLLVALAGCSVYDAAANEADPESVGGGYRGEGVANAGGSPKHLVAGNFDNVGGIDLAVLDLNLIMVYSPAVQGTPRSGVGINSLTFQFDLLATGEFDGDPFTELVAVQRGSANNTIRVLDPRGVMMVDEKTPQSPNPNMWSSKLAVGDFLDLADDEVAILLEGTRTIALFRDLDTVPERHDLDLGEGPNVELLAAANVDGDLQDELVIVRNTEVHVYDVMPGTPVTISPKGLPFTVVDGISELVVADFGSTPEDDIAYFKPGGGFGLLYSNGQTLEQGTEFHQLAGPVGIGKSPVAAQVTGSLRLDVCGLFGSRIECYTNELDNDFAGPERIPVDGSPDLLVAADLTGDGKVDFAHDSSLGGLTLLIAD